MAAGEVVQHPGFGSIEPRRYIQTTYQIGFLGYLITTPVFFFFLLKKLPQGERSVFNCLEKSGTEEHPWGWWVFMVSRTRTKQQSEHLTTWGGIQALQLKVSLLTGPHCWYKCSIEDYPLMDPCSHFYYRVHLLCAWVCCVWNDSIIVIMNLYFMFLIYIFIGSLEEFLLSLIFRTCTWQIQFSKFHKYLKHWDPLQ